MIKKLLWLGASIAIVTALFAAALAFTGIAPVQAAALDGRNRPGTPGGWSVSTGSSLYAYSSGALSSAEQDVLMRAIQEEQTAQALYQAVIDQFGATLPFSTIVQAEAQHLAALTNLAQKYGVSVPEPVEFGPTSFASLSEACQAGVAAEIADGALYDKLSPLVSHSDILRVFANLQRASLNSHLPAFEACN
jgi:hypothetical protein